ncbi:MAG: 1,4-dihydroxy-2-naphthoate polyprenyltransferase [Chloroflexi bacterium]|nr:1,4-dihydroxy-2-naphthoate polyprenyltransferase [Chloroflexota bacterium]
MADPADQRRPTLATWVRAARPQTLPAGITPVLVGAGVAAGAGKLDGVVFAAAFAGAVLIQIGANYANDLFDFQKGADRTDRLGPPRATATGVVTEGQIAAATLVAFGLAVLPGIYLLSVGGLPVVVVGLASLLAALTYVGGPWPYGYHGLGDPVCFLFFGVIPVATLSYLSTGVVTPAALLASVPVGCLITAILVINNYRDIEQDRAAGKRTVAVIIGPRATRAEYVALLAIAYAVPLIGAALGLWSPAGLLPWLTAPLARGLITRINTTVGRPLNLALRDTARLQLLFGALFAVGLALPR